VNSFGDLRRRIGPATAVLATARLTSMITDDEISRPVRDKVEEWASDKPEGSVPERLAYLVTCTRCVSVWAAGAVLVMSIIPPFRPLVRIMAGSQAAISTMSAVEWIEASIDAQHRKGIPGS